MPTQINRSPIQSHQYCANQLTGTDTTTKINSIISLTPSFSQGSRAHKCSHNASASTAALPEPAPSSALSWLTHCCLTWWVSSAGEVKRQYLRSFPWLQVRLIHSRKLYAFPRYLQIHQSSQRMDWICWHLKLHSHLFYSFYRILTKKSAV